MGTAFRVPVPVGRGAPGTPDGPAVPGPAGDPAVIEAPGDAAIDGAPGPDAKPEEGDPEGAVHGDADGEAVAGVRTDGVVPALVGVGGDDTPAMPGGPACFPGGTGVVPALAGAGGDITPAMPGDAACRGDTSGDAAIAVPSAGGAAEADPAPRAYGLAAGAALDETTGAGRVRPDGRTVRSKVTDRCEALLALTSAVTGGSPREDSPVRTRTRSVRAVVRSPRSQRSTVVDPLAAQDGAGGSQLAGASVVSTSRTPSAGPPIGLTSTVYSTIPGVTAATATEASTRTSRTGAADALSAAGPSRAEAGTADSGSGTCHATTGTVSAAVPTAVSTVLDTAFTAVPPQTPVGLRGDGPGAREAISPLLPHDRGA
ncbi:hypothetical protein GCM10023195_78760 [Actinoallomurus liliacearum]|uniref:Uncharacterized protein n=1 Tax=Actinoallomurus liliacearum TaxID=1080073 RepID=A0ABP8TZD2_9ACTN